MSVDILGTNCDQCRSMVQCCFTSTEIVRLVRTESPGRPPPLTQLLNSEYLKPVLNLANFVRESSWKYSANLIGS